MDGQIDRKYYYGFIQLLTLCGKTKKPEGMDVPYLTCLPRGKHLHRCEKPVGKPRENHLQIVT